MQATQKTVSNNEYRNISIAALVESETNPRKRFDQVAFEELAPYVPRHISGLSCR